MGSRYLDDRMEQDRDEIAADLVGLTFEEYQSLDPEITQDESSAGVETGHLVTFRAPIPGHLRSKITGLEGSFVRLPLGAFDQDDSDEQDQ